MIERKLIPALGLIAIAFALSATHALAEDASSAIQQALEASQRAKRGVMLHVNGATIGGGVVKIEPGQWVELKNQEYASIIVRIERIDAVSSR